MVNVPDNLKLAADKAYGQNKTRPVKTRPVKVRTFLSWFGAKRRGVQVETEIRSALKKVKLATDPDFMGANIESRIRLVPTVEIKQPKIENEQNELSISPTSNDGPSDVEANEDVPALDPTPRVGTIFGNNPPISVKRDETIKRAVTLMLEHDFSQLPVMPNERTLEGLISWKSIGHAEKIKGKRCEVVRDCINKDVEVLSADKPLWQAIKTIAEHDIVFIKDETNKISSVVTSADLSEKYHSMAEPFLILGEIENNLRQIITRADFPISKLRECKNPSDLKRQINSVNDLTFGEIVRFLENDENWRMTGLKLSRSIFVAGLKPIHKIRNEVMHFSPDPLDAESLKKLQKMSAMLRKLELYK